MKLTLLGTGDAGGVPRWGCFCPACATAHQSPERRRRPCSAMVELGDARVLIDAGRTDLAQCFKRGDIDAILLTHFHVDHVQGLFHLRWGVGDPLPVYGPDDDDGCADLYAHPGLLAFTTLAVGKPVQVGGLRFTPIPLQHSKLTLGYLMEGDGRVAYLTDTRGLSAEAAQVLCEFVPDILVIDATYPPGHPAPRNHNTIEDAVAIGAACAAPRVVLTHLGHDADCWLSANRSSLPATVEAGHDGLIIETSRVESWT